MIIDLSPNADRMILILLMLWTLHGGISLLSGLIKVKKEYSAQYGSVDIFTGIIMLGLVIWVLIG